MKRSSIRVYTLLLLFSAITISASAATPKQNKTRKKTTKTSTALAASKIQLEQTSENIQVITPQGDRVSLPKVEKILVENEDQPSLFSNNMLIADAGFSTKLLHEKMVEHKEMQELSSMLGISINDPSLLNFYREVADWLGIRYVWGGMSRKGVDCSGFTGIVYNSVFGQKLDRVSTVMAQNVKQSVQSKDDLIPGDLVFFSTFGKKYINHVGLYIGEGNFIHANIKRGVIVSSLINGYYSKVWRKGGRM